MYKSKYPSLIDFLTNQEDLILLDSEIQNIENLVDKDLKAITVTRCSTQLKGLNIPTLEEWINDNCTKPSFGTYDYKGKNYYTHLELHPIYVQEITKTL